MYHILTFNLFIFLILPSLFKRGIAKFAQLISHNFCFTTGILSLFFYQFSSLLFFPIFWSFSCILVDIFDGFMAASLIIEIFLLASEIILSFFIPSLITSGFLMLFVVREIFLVNINSGVFNVMKSLNQQLHGIFFVYFYIITVFLIVSVRSIILFFETDFLN